MNIEQLRQNVNQRVRLHPPAQRMIDGRLQPADDVWMVDAVTNRGQVTISSSFGWRLMLERDHIRGYTTDPPRSQTGLKHGILALTIAIKLIGVDSDYQPLAR